MNQQVTTLFLLDNVDSFTYNLVDELRTLNLDIKVYRNTVSANALFERMQEQATKGPVLLMLSPGPGAPSEAGCMPELLKKVHGVFPVIGICLGHQSIAQVFGGEVIRAKKVMHGKTSPIYHNNTSVFDSLPNPHTATRYHSLVVAQASLPECLEVTAWTEDAAGQLDEIMGISHKTLMVEGVQFHPESILTQSGHDLLAKFLTR